MLFVFSSGISSAVISSYLIKRTYGKEVTAAIAGTGTEEAELKNIVAELGIEKQIKFLGYVDDSALPRVYCSARIGVIPSKDKEGILTTMLEAASCGCPIISITVGRIPEFLKNEYNGLLVPPLIAKNLVKQFIGCLAMYCCSKS